MIFGDSVRAADGLEPAAWLSNPPSGREGTVGFLVPDRFESFLRLHAPDPNVRGWWTRYRNLFELVASVGAGHSTTPSSAWFAIWEGYGFGTTTTTLAWRDPPADDAERRWREAERASRRDADLERNARIRAALASIPRVERTHRAYYLLAGPLAAMADLRDPTARGWQRPDLFWPDDRAWFAATDTDFWSLYVGGTADFAEELAAVVPERTESVVIDDELPIED